MLKVLIVDNEINSAKPLKQSLIDNGFAVMAHVENCAQLQANCNALKPDVVVVNVNSSTPSILENIANVNALSPLPIVMFTQDGDKQKIKAATQAGVSAYVVGNIPNERLVPVIDAAIARFEEFKQLRAELNLANTKLDERKIIERAKGILMKQRDLDEDASYSLLRSMAMKKNMKLADLSNQLVEAAKMLII
jgi:two-component system, response regulator / RNA-binding antiterminator